MGVVIVVSCLAMASAWAGGAFEKEFASVAEATDEAKMSMMNGNGDGSDSGKGPVPYLKALGAPPKRVALISFYVWDCGNKKENFYNAVYHYKKTTNVQHGAIDAIANELYDASISGFKEEFAQYGVQILTPDEFLDTEEKKAAYDSRWRSACSRSSSNTSKRETRIRGGSREYTGGCRGPGVGRGAVSAAGVESREPGAGETEGQARLGQILPPGSAVRARPNRKAQPATTGTRAPRRVRRARRTSASAACARVRVRARRHRAAP